MISTESVGARIAARRREMGLSQSGLARRMCVSPQAVSKWERGLSLPDIVFIDELALALGITIDELLTGRVEAVVA